MKAPPPPDPRFGWSDFLMLTVVAVWGINFSIIKIALKEMTPDGFNGLRLILTAVVFLLLLAISGEGFRVGRSDLWKLALIGVLGNAAYQTLFIGGLSRTSASNTSFILAMSPIFVALLSWILRIERIPWAAWAGILVSFAGLYLVILGRNGGLRISGEGFRGDIMIFSGTILWASYTVFSKPFLERMSPLKFASLTMAFGTLAYIPLTAGAIVRVPWGRVSPGAWASLAFSALFSLVLGYLVWYSSVRRVGNARTAVYGNLTPAFTVLFAALVLGEKAGLREIFGASVILAGVTLTRFGHRIFPRRR